MVKLSQKKIKKFNTIKNTYPDNNLTNSFVTLNNKLQLQKPLKNAPAI